MLSSANWTERAPNASDTASDYEHLFPLPKESRVLGAPSASAPPQRTSSSRHWLQTIGKWNFGMAFGDSRKRVAANAKYAILRALSLTPPFSPRPLFRWSLGAVALDVATPGAASTVDDPLLPQVRKNVTRCSICCPAFGLKHFVLDA
jgi:hypothetical protein